MGVVMHIKIRLGIKQVSWIQVNEFSDIYKIYNK